MRHGLLTACAVAVTCLVTFEAARSDRLALADRLPTLVAGIVVVVLTGLVTVRWPGWWPAVLLFLVSIVPYQVSFVGKTPFGVVSFAGLLGALSVGLLFLVHGKGNVDLVKGPETVAMALWGGLLFLSAALSSDPRQSLNIARTIVVALPLAYLAGRLIARLDSRALGRVAAVAGVLALLAVLEEATPFTPYSFVPTSGFPLVAPPEAVREGLERVRLGYYHGSTLGTVLVVVLPAVLLHPRLGLRRRPWLFPAVLAAILLTVTFQVWVAAVAVLLLLGAGLRRIRVGLAVGVLAAGLVLASGAIAPLNQLIENRLHPSGSHADEYYYRLQLWPASLREASTGPVIGRGPGLFNSLQVTGTVRGQTVVLVDDNTVTAKLVETGFVGVAALVAVIALVARRMWANAVRWRAWAGLAALSAWCVMAMSVELLLGDQALVPCWFVLGMLSYSGDRKAVDA